MKTKSNAQFGSVIAPLIKPMYVLQMARSKSWSKKAQQENLLKFADACEAAERRARLEARLILKEIIKERLNEKKGDK